MNMLLWLNPELQKNLWLELTPGRLIGMPIVLGLIAAGTYTMINPNTAMSMMILIAGAMLILWGSRSAADSMTDELTARTWDIHRLGSRRATGLVLGKLFGGTIYIWYGAAIACAIALWIEPARWRDVVGVALCGLIAQSAALFISVALKGSGRSRRAHNLVAQAIALGATVIVRYILRFTEAHRESVVWYNYTVDAGYFVNALTAGVSLWFIIGTIRLVRRELGFRDGPAGWSVFTLCVIGVTAGFLSVFQGGPAVSISLDDRVAVGYELMPFLAAMAATYLALLGGQADYGRWSRLGQRLRSGQPAAAWTELPPWVAGAALTILCANALCVPHPEYAPFCMAAAGFMLRDALVVTGVTLRDQGRSGSMITGYFLLVGIVAPYLARTQDWGSFFFPIATAGYKGAALPWVEALAALVIFASTFSRTLRSAPLTAPMRELNT